MFKFCNNISFQKNFKICFFHFYLHAFFCKNILYFYLSIYNIYLDIQIIARHIKSECIKILSNADNSMDRLFNYLSIIFLMKCIIFMACDIIYYCGLSVKLFMSVFTTRYILAQIFNRIVVLLNNNYGGPSQYLDT